MKDSNNIKYLQKKFEQVLEIFNESDTKQHRIDLF